MKYTGMLVKKLWGEGSKSESERVILITKDKEYVLRRKGGNPFQDNILDKLVVMNEGKEVTVNAELIGDYTLQIELVSLK